MNCRDLSRFLDEYVAGELPPTVASEFELHISRCGNCDTYLLQYPRNDLPGPGGRR